MPFASYDTAASCWLRKWGGCGGRTFLGSIDEDIRRRFEAAWHGGQSEPVEHFLPPDDGPRFVFTPEELRHIELEPSWKRFGQRRQEDNATMASRLPVVEDYPTRFLAWLDDEGRGQVQLVLHLAISAMNWEDLLR